MCDPKYCRYTIKQKAQFVKQCNNTCLHIWLRVRGGPVNDALNLKLNSNSNRLLPVILVSTNEGTKNNNRWIKAFITPVLKSLVILAI